MHVQLTTPTGTLLDGVALNAAHPATFLIPDAETREHVEVGAHVKIGLRGVEDTDPGERFWAQVISRSENGYLVQVDNHLVYSHLHGVRFEDFLVIQPNHILAA